MRSFRALFIAMGAFAGLPLSADPLPSWADTEAKARIVDFVERVTDTASPDYATPDARIPTFDNDGTLWAEQPSREGDGEAFGPGRRAVAPAERRPGTGDRGGATRSYPLQRMEVAGCA